MGREELSRYFIASGCPIATTTLYRCVHLQEQLQSLGYTAEVAEWFDEAMINPEKALAHDVIVLYRLPLCSQLEKLVQDARELGKPVIFDTDDLIFEPELTAWHRAVRNLTPADQNQHLEGVRRYLATLLACDAAIVATPLLAELARRRGKRAFLHRNALGREMLELADRLYLQRRDRTIDDKVVIGYGSGTPTHDVDFQETTAALISVLQQFPQVELWIAGPLALPPALENFGARLRRFPLMDWRGWFDLMSQFDIALAPLEIGNIFCRAKSEIKFVEAGVLGVPVIASDIDPFRDSITDGRDGILAANKEGWEQALRLLVTEPALRLAMGEEARRSILPRCTPQVRAIELAAMLPQILSSRAEQGTSQLTLG